MHHLQNLRSANKRRSTKRDRVSIERRLTRRYGRMAGAVGGGCGGKEPKDTPAAPTGLREWSCQGVFGGGNSFGPKTRLREKELG